MKVSKRLLSEIAYIIAGQSPSSTYYNKNQEGLPFYQGKADYGDKYPIAKNWCTGEKHKEALKNDILLSVRAPVGPVNICNGRSVIGRGLSAIRTKEGYNFEYLYFYLKNHEKEIAKLGTGSTFKAITQAQISKLNILLPETFDDQSRIADILTRAEALIVKRKESIQALDEFLKSTFFEIFGDPLRNEKGWEKKAINEIGEVRIGPFGSLLHAGDYVENGVPIINPSHIKDGEIMPDYSLTITPQKYNELRAYQLHDNDVVVARRGEIGRCAIVRTSKPLFCGTGCMFIRIFCDYLPQLLQYQIYSTPLKGYLESKAKGITMKNLNSTTLEEIQILYPPQPVQNQFATIVEKVESIKAKYYRSLIMLVNFYDSLSQQAFTGKIDLNRIPVEAEKRVIEDEMNLTITEGSRTYSEAELVNTIHNMGGDLFDFEDIMTSIEEDSFEEMPEYEELKRLIYNLLEGSNPFLSQTFDKDRKKIMLRVSI